MIKRILQIINHKLQTNSGNIVMPVLFIVTAFGVLLVSGDLINISFVDKTLQFNNPKTTDDPESGNLQLKKVSFQAQPTPIADTCNHDMFKRADPDRCECVAALIRCENNVCVEINPDKSGSAFKDWTCEQANQFNWCQIFAGEGDGWYCIGKPVIYLYPVYPMLVDVRVKTAGEVVISDPPIEPKNTWTDVMAHPNGILFYRGYPYRELFYESETQNIHAPKKGLVFKAEELETKLLEFITRLGLTRSGEQKEFIDWWLPRLETYESPYWFVSILDRDEKQRLDKVEIEPKPDTFIEFIAYFKPLEEFEKVETLHLPPTPQRKGFTAVEWGGIVDSN